MVSSEVFERGNPFSNLCLLVGQADAVYISVREAVFPSSRRSGYCHGVYFGLVPQVFIFASLRSMKFVRRGSRADHISNGVVGWNERKDVFGVRDDDVQHVGLIGGEHAFYRWFEVAAEHNSLARHVEAS